VSTSGTAFVDHFPRGPVLEPTRVTSFAEFARVFGPVHSQSNASYAVRQFFLNGGSVAWVVRVELAEDALPGADGTGGDPTAVRAAVVSGLNVLTAPSPGDVNLLCLPVASTLGEQQGELLRAAVIWCEEQGVILLVDPPLGPAGASAAAVTSWCAGEDGPPASNHAAFYWPRLVVPDPTVPGTNREIGPSGSVAGIMARLDSSRGVWKAPAGNEATIRGAELAVVVDESDEAQLSLAGVNALRALPSGDALVWGARTLGGAGTGEWRYLSVRRTALFLEQSLVAGLQGVVFEPNDEPLWSQIRLTVGSFLSDLFRQQAFQGNSPDDACYVRCGRDTMSQDEIDRGVVNVVVGFAPVRPAEFVVLRIRLVAGEPPPD
jgi:hypothetical protein